MADQARAKASAEWSFAVNMHTAALACQGAAQGKYAEAVAAGLANWHAMTPQQQQAFGDALASGESHLAAGDGHLSAGDVECAVGSYRMAAGNEKYAVPDYNAALFCYDCPGDPKGAYQRFLASYDARSAAGTAYNAAGQQFDVAITHTLPE